MSIAKRDLGKIDKELRKEQPADECVQRFGRQPRSGAWRRAFEAGARGGAEQVVPGRQGRRHHAAGRRRAQDLSSITTALGTYCVRYADKNRAWDQGQANLGEPLIGACPHMFKGL